MKRIYLIILIKIIITMNIRCIQQQPADLIVHNAVIYTLDNEFATSEAMAVRDGLIVAIGSDRDILSRFHSQNILKAEGKTVMPGFIDAHSHFIGYALGLLNADLRPANSFEKVLEILSEHAKTNACEWITGYGWDQNRWPNKQFPTNKNLNELFPNHPVVLSRIDGHAVLVNNEAMRRLAITDSQILPEGEAIRDSGKLTGVFLGTVAKRFRAAVPAPTNETIVKLLEKAQQNCFAVGLTSVTDAGLDFNQIQLLDSLQNTGQLKIRIYAMINPTAENLDYFLPKGPILKPALTIRSVKLFADGALGSRGARLLEEYSDAPGEYGVWGLTEEKIKQICSVAYAAGYQVITHAIGDAANRRILNVYSNFLKQKNDLRWRIEHAQVVHPDDFHLFGDYSIIPSIQSTHATSDMSWAGYRLGSQRLESAYATRTLLEQNGWLPNGTDFPIEGINPMWTFYAAVTRQNHNGYPESGFQPKQKLSRSEALKSITIWAAKAKFWEHERGSLEPGKFADFVMLDKDPMIVPYSDLLSIRVEQVFVGGTRVH